MITAIWQEHGCDGCAIDFDLYGKEILAAGERVYCSGCGGHHAAGVEPGPTQTYVAHDDREEFEIRELPRDAAEKAEWLAAVGQPDMMSAPEL